MNRALTATALASGLALATGPGHASTAQPVIFDFSLEIDAIALPEVTVPDDIFSLGTITGFSDIAPPPDPPALPDLGLVVGGTLTGQAEFVTGPHVDPALFPTDDIAVLTGLTFDLGPSGPFAFDFQPLADADPAGLEGSTLAEITHEAELLPGAGFGRSGSFTVFGGGAVSGSDFGDVTQIEIEGRWSSVFGETSCPIPPNEVIGCELVGLAAAVEGTRGTFTRVAAEAPAPVPLPAGVVLFGTALLGLGAAARGRDRG